MHNTNCQESYALIRYHCSSYKSYCIRDSPLEKEAAQDYLKLNDALPGTLYDADTQCRQQYGGVAKHCPMFKVEEMFKKIIIHCYMKLDKREYILLIWNHIIVPI